MIIYIIEVTFLKMPDFDVFLFWNVKKVKVDLNVNVKSATLSAKMVLKNA